MQARKAIWRYGPAMVAGVAVATATMVFAEFFVLRPMYFFEIMGAGVSLAFFLIVYALRHGLH